MADHANSTTTSSRRLFLAAGSAGAVFAALRGASALSYADTRVLAAPEVLSVDAAFEFDPAEYVAVWERCGNIVYWDFGSDGKEWFAIYLPDEARYPEFEELRRPARDAKGDYTSRLIVYLKGRGQKAGLPLKT